MFLTQQGLDNLKLYKYTGVDLSLCARFILSPYVWEPLLKIIPLWIAPNLITLIGGLFMVFAYLFYYFQSPDGLEEITPIISLITAVCIFLYQTADNLDGKQARRTKNSSALGELFDHGVDTFMMGIFSLCVVMILRFDTKIQFFLFICLLSAFYMSHWEEYHTNSLVLGYIFNPTELQLFCIGALLIHTIYPYWIDIYIYTVGVREIAQYVVFAFALVADITYLFGTFRHIKQHKNYTPLQALKHGAPYIFFFVTSFIIILALPTKFMQQHYHLLAMMFIFYNAYVTQRLIVHRICKEQVSYFHPILIAYFVYMVFVLLNGMEIFTVNLPFLTTVVFIAIVACESYFIYEVVTSFASHLKINILRITPVEEEIIDETQ